MIYPPAHDPNVAQAIRADMVRRADKADPTPPSPVAEAPPGYWTGHREGAIITGADGFDGQEVTSICVNVMMPKEQADILRRMMVDRPEHTLAMLRELQEDAVRCLLAYPRIIATGLR